MSNQMHIIGIIVRRKSQSKRNLNKPRDRGENKYVEHVEKILETTKKIKPEIL